MTLVCVILMQHVHTCIMYYQGLYVLTLFLSIRFDRRETQGTKTIDMSEMSGNQTDIARGVDGAGDSCPGKFIT